LTFKQEVYTKILPFRKKRNKAFAKFSKKYETNIFASTLGSIYSLISFVKTRNVAIFTHLRKLLQKKEFSIKVNDLHLNGISHLKQTTPSNIPKIFFKVDNY
jgi:hypothetical protein